MSPYQRETRAFVVAHVVLLCIVFMGFARSFYLRQLFLHSPLPSRLVVHGVALTLWFVLVTTQGLLAQSGQRAWHKRIAWLAVPVVVATVGSGLWVNTALAMTLKSASDPENMFIWTNYVALLSFAALVGVAVALRRRPATHRRLILFASILITGPALARLAFWPILGQGLAAAPIFALGGMALLVAAAICYDLVANRSVQRATLGGVAGVVLPWIAGTAVALSGVGFALLHRVAA